MVIHLRPYQLLALDHLRRCLEAGAWRQYLDLPTGTGKSRVAAAFAAQRLGQTQGRVLALVHRQDLALQLAETLRREELEVGLLMEGSRALHTPVVVATIQSLTPEATRDLLAAHSAPILTVLIDEAHHAVPGSLYERILATIEQAAGAQPVAIVGLTATPYRNDELSMLSLLPIRAFARTIPEMVQEGYLAPLTWNLVQLDLAQVATTRGTGALDYAETTLAGQLRREAITARLVEHAASLIGQQPTLVFAASVQHAAHLNATRRKVASTARGSTSGSPSACQSTNGSKALSALAAAGRRGAGGHPRPLPRGVCRQRGGLVGGAGHREAVGDAGALPEAPPGAGARSGLDQA